MDDMQVWKAAVAQLLISLFPNNFLPEILGFNLHYEQLTLETLKAARELPQFGISGYYFHIHVSIDNADSGHTAMALNVVANYMRQVEETKGINVAQDMWKRVQAGYVLSQVLGAEEAQVLDPLPHRMPLTQLEGRLLDIFKAKARASHRIHCASKVKIGQRSLVEWLSPKNWGSPEWQTDFLSELSRAKPWIKKGNSENSLLIRELEWKGRMFGAFTDAEVKVLAQWIDDPEPTKSDWQPSYWQLLGCKDYAKNTILGDSDLAVDHPVFLVKSESSEVRVLEVVPALASDEAEQDCQQGLPAHHLPEKLTVLGLRLSRFLPLWFSHTCLLENYISTPYHTSTRLGQDIVRLLRADYGYSIESKGVAGMDEYMKTCQTSIVDLGLQIMRHQHLPEPKCLKDILFEKEENISQVRFAYSMLEWAMYPKKNLGLLLGLARAFLELECWLSSEGSLLIKEEREALRQIVDRKRISLDRCFEEIQTEITHYRGFLRGYAIGRAEIEKVFQVTES